MSGGEDSPDDDEDDGSSTPEKSKLPYAGMKGIIITCASVILINLIIAIHKINRYRGIK